MKKHNTFISQAKAEKKYGKPPAVLITEEHELQDRDYIDERIEKIQKIGGDPK